MLSLAMKLNASRADLSLDFQRSEVLVREWIHDLEQAEEKSRRLSVVPIGPVRRLFHSFSGIAPEIRIEKKLLRVVADEQRRRMGQLYLQAQISKTCETFSRPNHNEALWMPVHALLCRDRFAFTCSFYSDGTKSEPVLEDILFHHVAAIGSADVVEHRPGEWIIQPSGKLVHQRSSFTLFGSLRSRRVADEDHGIFKVETPAPAQIFRSGKWQNSSVPTTTTNSHFLRLTVACRGVSLGLRAVQK